MAPFAEPHDPASPEKRPRPGDGWAQAALWVALVGWMGACCTLPGLSNKSPAPAFKSEAERAGFMAAEAMFALTPAAIAGLGALVGAVALVKGTRRRGEALAGLGLGGVYVVAVGVGFLATFEVGPFGRGPRPTGAPLTLDEVHAFGDQLTRTLGGGDAGFFFDRLDVEALVQLAGNARPRSRELEQVGKNLRSQQERFGKDVARAISQGGSYRVAHVQVGPEPRLVVRLLSPEGLNYHVLSLVRGRDGQVMVSDLFVLIGAVRMSEVLRQELIPAERTRLNRIQRLSELLREGRAEEAVQAWQALDAATRRRPLALMLYLRAATQVGPEAQMAALTEIEQARLPELSLALIDLHWERGDYARCEALVEDLERAVGDPYLDAFHANVLVMRGEGRAAQALAARARDAVPELQETWWAVANANLAAGDHAAAREAMQRLVTEFAVRAERLDAELDLATFQRSPEQAAWEAFKAER